MALDKDLDAFKDVQETKTVDATKKLRIGFIGCGWIAGSHIRSFKKQPDVEIVAGCDLIPGKAAAFFEKNGVEGVKTDYASHKEMLDDESLKLDAVTICTYNRQHAGPAIYALKKGINVLLEKPFTVTLDEAVEVVLTLGILGVENADKNVRKAKNAVEDGGIRRALGAVGVRRVYEDRLRQSGFRNGNDVERVTAEPPDNLFGIAHASDNGGSHACCWTVHTSLDGILTAAERVHEGGLACSCTADNGNDGFGIELLLKRLDVAQRIVERGGKIPAVRPVVAGFKLGCESSQPPPLLRKT